MTTESWTNFFTSAGVGLVIILQRYDSWKNAQHAKLAEANRIKLTDELKQKADEVRKDTLAVKSVAVETKAAVLETKEVIAEVKRNNNWATETKQNEMTAILLRILSEITKDPEHKRSADSAATMAALGEAKEKVKTP